MSRKEVVGACPACATSIGWRDLSHDGILHGRQTSQGGPYFTIACPACGLVLRAEGGVGRIYRFASIARGSHARPSRWGRWLDLLFGAYEPVFRPPPVTPRTGHDSRARSEATRRDGTPRYSARVRRSFHVLGLRADARAPDVKRRYRQLAKEWHPDRFSRSSEVERATAERRFIEIAAAYEEIVGDEQFLRDQMHRSDRAT